MEIPANRERIYPLIQILHGAGHLHVGRARRNDSLETSAWGIRCLMWFLRLGCGPLCLIDGTLDGAAACGHEPDGNEVPAGDTAGTEALRI